MFGVAGEFSLGFEMCQLFRYRGFLQSDVSHNLRELDVFFPSSPGAIDFHRGNLADCRIGTQWLATVFEYLP